MPAHLAHASAMGSQSRASSLCHCSILVHPVLGCGEQWLLSDIHCVHYACYSCRALCSGGDKYCPLFKFNLSITSLILDRDVP
jgi:hypothetical protein